MAGLVGTVPLPDLTPVAAEAGTAEGDPRPLYSWAGPRGYTPLIRFYTPSDGGAPRLVARVRGGGLLDVWHTGTGAWLGALQGPDPSHEFSILLTYQRASDGRPRVAAGMNGGHVCIWDGDDLHLLHSIRTIPNNHLMQWLVVYDEPISGRTRLVSA
jgi:hypothetical protein